MVPQRFLLQILLLALSYVSPLLHLVGILFPHINDDARSKSHQICMVPHWHSCWPWFLWFNVKESSGFFRIDVARGKNSYGSVHYTSLANGGAYPIHVCEMCSNFDLTNVASRNVVQVRGLYKVWRIAILRASNY